MGAEEMNTLRVAAALGLIILAGCTTPSGSFCSMAKAVRLTPEQIATLSDAQVEQLVATNRKGAKFCGWRP